MDWVDMSVVGDYHMKQLGIDQSKMVFLEFSYIDPKS